MEKSPPTHQPKLQKMPSEAPTVLVSTGEPEPQQKQSKEPRGRSSLRLIHQRWLEEQCAKLSNVSFKTVREIKAELKDRQLSPAAVGSVAIVGAGMAGLAAGVHLLCTGQYGAQVTLFEADSRPGGRLFTHHFAHNPEVYCEIGGMRLPSNHNRVASLINCLRRNGQDLELIPYIMSSEDNRVFVNGQLMTKSQAEADPSSLGFGFEETAESLLDQVIGPLVHELKNAEAEGDGQLDIRFREMIELYDTYSLERYLQEVAGWTVAKINYVETMTNQTNAFKVSLIEHVMDAFEFDEEDADGNLVMWQTIAGGMRKLPSACLTMLANAGAAIRFNSRVTELEYLSDGKIQLTWQYRGRQEHQKAFDKVLLALPPTAVRMIKTPVWSVEKQHALRALRFDPIRKIGLRFKSRWWEQLNEHPMRGGQSITDLPSRWIVYPSNDIGGKGEGALLCYSWTGDAYAHLTLTTEQKEALALRDLKAVHPAPLQLADGRVVDLDDEFLSAFPFEWAQSWAGGIAFFYPGQWKELYAAAQLPEKNANKVPVIYFAGEHLSKHHAWVEGALDSAVRAVNQMVADHTEDRGEMEEQEFDDRLESMLRDMPFD